MNKEEIETGNKLIAEFIGASVWKSYWNKNDKSDWFDIQPFEDIGIHGINIGSGNTKDLYFHSSWDWLMPVVESIENIERTDLYKHPQFRLSSYRYLPEEWKADIQDCKTTKIRFQTNNCNSKLEATWLVIIEFIKWYNTQNNE
jgi:hypothetical protein